MMPEHLPVLERDVVELFAPEAGQRFLDCTFGGGGHARCLLEAAQGVQVTALDCDPDARARAEEFGEEFGECFRFCDLNFSNLDRAPGDGFDGILFDLGVSSFQLDVAERGFSFKQSGCVDMRLDPRVGEAAASFLEKAPRDRLEEAVRDFGEEQHWQEVVKAIVEARGTGALQETTQLAALVAQAVGPQFRKAHPTHPATKTFQGIRIAVNGEIARLEEALPKAMEKLAPGGVLIVISFHSLEDRLVKRFFRQQAGQAEHRGDATPKQFRKCVAELLVKRAVRPTVEEVIINSRSRSARLRAIRKLG